MKKEIIYINTESLRRSAEWFLLGVLMLVLTVWRPVGSVGGLHCAPVRSRTSSAPDRCGSKVSGMQL